MSVTLTAVQLAASLRIGDGTTALVEPQASVLARVLGTAKATVELYAKDAPSAVQNEAAVRMAAYLYDAQPGNSSRFVHAFQDSGAQALLAPWRVQRAVALVDEPYEEDAE